MKNLRSKLIRLAHENPELRDHLLPLVTKTGGTLRDTVEDSITETIMRPTQVVNDPKLAKFLRRLSKYLARSIQYQYQLGKGEFSVADDYGKEMVIAKILDVELAIKVNRATKMIDFAVKRNAFTIPSMSWDSASIGSICDAIEDAMQDELDDFLYRNR